LNVTLYVFEDRWSLREAECPCDIHFVNWVNTRPVRQSTIYHFGSGSHHIVGRNCTKLEHDNVVLSITASIEEYMDYMNLIIAQPELAKRYHCYFGDIYCTDTRLLPPLDVVTLFHLCEYRCATNDRYGALDDVSLTLALAARTREGGHILLYSNSSHFELAANAIETVRSRGLIEPAGRHQSLVLYRRTGVPV
jgi:hypothetical protein